MSDTNFKTSGRHITANLPCLVLPIFIILAAHLGMSNAILGGARTIPYDEGGTEDIPSAAARLCNIRCNRVPSGCIYTFDVEVFETCWEPVYAVEIQDLTDAVEPAVWPEGWKAGTAPSGVARMGSVVFYTVSHPILPGTVKAGFGLVSYSGSVDLRWFPADKDGLLIGKVSRLELSCPVGLEGQSWGAIKAIYR